MNALLHCPPQQRLAQRSTLQEKKQFWRGFAAALILVVIECSPLSLWLLRLATGTSLDLLPNFVQTLAIVGGLYCLTALAGIVLAWLEARQFFGIGMLVGMAVGIFVGAAYSAALFLLLVVNACHAAGAGCA